VSSNSGSRSNGLVAFGRDNRDCPWHRSRRDRTSRPLAKILGRAKHSCKNLVVSPNQGTNADARSSLPQRFRPYSYILTFARGLVDLSRNQTLAQVGQGFQTNYWRCLVHSQAQPAFHPVHKASRTRNEMYRIALLGEWGVCS
jgi:hypothetical protein